MLRLPITISCLVIASLTLAQSGTGQKAANNPAITPQPRIAQWWFARHAEKIGEMSKGKVELMMVGDSITNNFDTVGKEIWKKHFEPRKAINLGFGGDRTNHVLWRLDHLPRPKTAPKAAVVMIGTNNICWGSDKPKQTAVGVQAIAKKLNTVFPEMKILVLGVFPRRRQPSHPHRKQIVELNSYLPALLKDVKNTRFLDIGAIFLDDKGGLPKEMMPDTTHPSEKGHRVWAEALEPELDKLLGSSPRKYMPQGKAAKADKVYLMRQFRQIALLMGKRNTDKAKILSGPKAVQLKRGKAPGRVWQIALGEHRFKISIEDATKLSIKAALKKVELVPPLYRRCFEIVSEPGKDGVAFYKTLGGAAAHGGQSYLNIIDRVGAKVMVHEAGHVMEQRARDTEKDILEDWQQAIDKDKISISAYGDKVVHEDLAEFARLYAFCLSAGKAELRKLKHKSPKRYQQWTRILRLAKATPLSLGGAQLDIRAAGETAVRVTAGVNLAPVAEPSTSHVSRDTSLAALHDGHAPKTSHVRGKGSYGNWPSKGTQWVQYDWAAPVRTRKIDVFWWDDRGGVRLPKACRLFYWDGKRFVPVRNPSGLGVAKDTFNTTTFGEVRTSKLRLEIDGNENFSTGILEWKVYNEGELPNFPPSVMAGVDRIVVHGRKTPFAGQLLRAISTDTTKLTWSKASGPGRVAFADNTALATTATFSAVGDYVLTLTARKGKMSDSSTLAVRVVARPQLDIRAAGKTGVRITIQPHDSKDKFPYTPALVERDYPKAVISLRELDSAFEPVKARVGQMNVTVQSRPLSVLVTTLDNKPLQKIAFAPDGTMSFVLDDQPVLGMGEGGPKQTGNSWRTDKIELDRRGRLHPMTPWYGTGTYGSYNPVPLMIGTAGWGLFIPTPSGAIDLSDSETGSFIPADPIAPGTVVSRRQQREGRIGLPPPEYFIPGTYDVFVFDTQNPPAFMKDISTLSGQAVLPPKWVMGYQQSHRTLKDDTQMLEIIDTFRKKRIPLDSVCYLGTGFCPSGWNKSQPSFEFNPGVFKRDPKEVLADMHKRNVKVMMHMIPWDRDRLKTLHGSIPATADDKVDDSHILPYWKQHEDLVDAGVDAWWPDEGDWFSFHERMKRHELYYTGPLSKQPKVRPWSLHRNGYLGVARWGGWMWPGDPFTTWRTLQTHIAIGINHSLSVSPFWNSDIGAFYTTDEYSAELYVRWVQFAAFNSLMRSHGRGWENRLPWTWGLSEPGPGEGSYAPPKSAMNNPTVEPIAKKYIELRYQLLSYNYTLTWEARETGMPMMRSLWLHYPKDKKARGIGDEYLWGRDMLIAPVYEKGATTREVYLPAGKWYDWWTGKLETGGRSLQRAVDLATMPIYVRAGAIVPVDPIRQHTGEKVDEPMTLKIYRGADGQYTLYDDDGISLGYLKGDSVQTLIKWDDSAKRLTLEPTTKQKAERKFKIELIPDGVTKKIRYTGQRLHVKF